ncbi:MAG TPA: hypothetical protein VF322_02780 [Gammaproteobacteria bacterium]
MARSLLWLARIVGVGCGGLAALAWSYAMWVPSAGITLSGVSFVGALMMALFALIGAIAAYRGHAVVLVLVFLASFFPVGFFWLTTDHWLRYVAMLDFGFPVAAALVFAARRTADKVPAEAGSGVRQ